MDHEAKHKIELLNEKLDNAIDEYMEWVNARIKEMRGSYDEDALTVFMQMRDATSGLARDFKEEIVKYLENN